MTQRNKQRNKPGQLLTGMNPLNAKSRAEEICKILGDDIPSVEKMNTLLTKYGMAFTLFQRILQWNNRTIRKSITPPCICA